LSALAQFEELNVLFTVTTTPIARAFTIQRIHVDGVTTSKWKLSVFVSLKIGILWVEED
jgi:hypothetical protein